MSKPGFLLLQELAIFRSGILLSNENEYKDAHSKLLWQCKEGHQWKACRASIQNMDSWCPQCCVLTNERTCKKLLEQKLNIQFKKERFYYDPTNKYKFYELDGYNKEYNLAFEYNGEQHYNCVLYFNQTVKDLSDLQQRDIDKTKWCKDNNIILLIIPYTAKRSLERYIDQLIENLSLRELINVSK